MEQAEKDKLIDRILVANMGELSKILMSLDLNNCPMDVSVAWCLRHRLLCEEIDLRTIEIMENYIQENQDRAVQVTEDFWTIPLRSEKNGKGNL